MLSIRPDRFCSPEKEILEAATDINAPTNSGRTPVIAAASGIQTPEVVTTLLKAGADIKALTFYGGQSVEDGYELIENQYVKPFLVMTFSGEYPHGSAGCSHAVFMENKRDEAFSAVWKTVTWIQAIIWNLADFVQAAGW